MAQSPSWEANRFSASQEIPRILWNSKIHYRNHKCPPPVPSLSQLDRVHASTPHFLKIHLNIILPSMPGSPKSSISPRFPHQNPIYASPLPSYALHAPPISFFSILSAEQYWARSTDHQAPQYLVSPLPCHLVPFRPKYSPLLDHCFPKHTINFSSVHTNSSASTDLKFRQPHKPVLFNGYKRKHKIQNNRWEEWKE